MIRNLVFISIFIFIGSSTKAQEVKNDADKTKMDNFVSKTGSIIKFVDTKLPNLKSSFASSETRVRKITSGTTTGYFYQIIKEGKYGDKTASIEYTDLIEVLKALEILKREVERDIASNPDYMENKFITEDGFQVGYYVSKGKVSWYITLERYGSDSSLFIDNGNIIEGAFALAKEKIDELRK